MQGINMYASWWLHNLEVGYSLAPAFMLEKVPHSEPCLAAQRFQRLQPHQQVPLLAYQQPVADSQ